MASHPVGHSADAARNLIRTVLPQSVTLAFRTGVDTGSSAQTTSRSETNDRVRDGSLVKAQLLIIVNRELRQFGRTCVIVGRCLKNFVWARIHCFRTATVFEPVYTSDS